MLKFHKTTIFGSLRPRPSPHIAVDPQKQERGEPQETRMKFYKMTHGRVTISCHVNFPSNSLWKLTTCYRGSPCSPQIILKLSGDSQGVKTCRYLSHSWHNSCFPIAIGEKNGSVALLHCVLMIINQMVNPLTPKSDQRQTFPAASPEILRHTVGRSWLGLKYGYATQFFLPHPYISPQKVGRMYFLGLGVKG